MAQAIDIAFPISTNLDQDLNLEDISYSTTAVNKSLNQFTNNILLSASPYSLLHSKFASYKPMEWTIEVKIIHEKNIKK